MAFSRRLSSSIADAKRSSSGKRQVGATVISPEEAILILQGWLESGVKLRMISTLFGFSVTSECRVVEVRGDTLILESEDKISRFAVTIRDPELCFTYAEPRSKSDADWYPEVPESEQCRSALVIGFPARVRLSNVGDVPSSLEKVFLMERPE